MSNPNHRQALVAIVNALLDWGVEIESPYDVENWFEDHCTHSDMNAIPFFEEILRKEEEKYEESE